MWMQVMAELPATGCICCVGVDVLVAGSGGREAKRSEKELGIQVQVACDQIT
jgi:hypothetical protein